MSTMHTRGTWFAAYGCVYSLLKNGEVVRVSLMDREEKNTYGAERDANVRFIVSLQNVNVGRQISESDLAKALKNIG